MAFSLSFPRVIAVAAFSAAAVAVVLSVRAAALEDPEITRQRRKRRREKRLLAKEGFDKAKLLKVLSDVDGAVNKIMSQLFQLEQRVRQQSAAAGQVS